MLLLAALVPSGPAWGDLNGVRLAVLDAKGPAAYGGAAIMRELKAKLAAAGLKLVEQAELNKAGKELKLKPSSEQDFAKLGKHVGAPYVLRLITSKKGWLFTANAQLINTETAEIQMDFKSGYYKPKEEAADRGERIARTTLEKLATLTSGGIGAIATAPPPKGPVNDRIDDPPPPSPKPRGSVDDKVDGPPPSTPDIKPNPYADPKPSPSPASSASASPTPAASPAPAASPSPAPATSPRSPASGPASGSSATAQVRPAEPDDSEKLDSFRASVVAGSALVHTYSLSTASGAESTLSYNLSPMALFAGDAEYIINKIHLGVGGRVSFSPTRFQPQPSLQASGLAASFPGSLLDIGVNLRGHFALSGQGRRAIELVPTAGLRIGMLNVADHLGNVVHGYTEVAPALGVGLRLPVGERFEFLAAVEGGLVLSHSETPADSVDGTFSSGFLFGSDLGARFWLSGGVGIALDARFELRSISLSGPSLRQTPPREDLTNVGISSRDLKVGLGLAFRI